MGYFLLCMECLLALCLCVAIGLAMASQVKNGQARWILALLSMIILPFVVILGMVIMVKFGLISRIWSGELYPVVLPFIGIVGLGTMAITCLSMFRKSRNSNSTKTMKFAWLIGCAVSAVGMIYIIVERVVEFMDPSSSLPHEIATHLSSWWLFFEILLAGTIGIGVVLFIRAIGRDDETEGWRAQDWNIGLIGLGILIAIGLCLATFSGIDNSIKQRLADLQNEARALGASVAPPKLLDEDNAAVLYYQAHTMRGDERKWNERWAPWRKQFFPGPGEFEVTDPELIGLLKQDQPIIHVLRKAADRKGCYVPRSFEYPSWFELIPEVGWMYSFTFLLGANAQVEASRGNWQSAITDINAIFRTAEHNSSEPYIFTTSHSANLEVNGINTLRVVIERFGPNDDQLQRIEFARMSYPRNLRRGSIMDYAMGLSLLAQLGQADSWISHFAPLEILVDSDALMPLQFYRVFLASEELEDFRSSALRLVAISEVSPSLESYQELLEHHDEHFAKLRFIAPKDFFGKGYTKWFLGAYRAAAMRDIARVAVAVNRFERRHNKLPESLDELTPEFLDFIPIDLFSGQSLRYTVNDDHWIVYSIGPDQVDDQGTSFDAATDKGDHMWKQSTKDD